MRTQRDGEHGPAEEASRRAASSLEQLVRECRELMDAAGVSGRARSEFEGFLDGARRQFQRHISCAAGAGPGQATTKRDGPSFSSTAAVLVRVPESRSVELKPIGELRTVFPELNGCPRQSSLAPSVPGIVKLHAGVQPSVSLRGLTEYSHVWLITIFHGVTNLAFHPSVSPPLADGARMGVFATRSPHRPNALSLSLCKIQSVDLEAGEVHVLGVDMCDGTPVIDLKPFVPSEVLTRDSVRWPAWLDKERLSGGVTWTEEAIGQLRKLEPTLKMLSSTAEVVEVAEQVLRLDPRTTHARQAHSDKIYGVILDSLNLVYMVDDLTRSCKVVKAQPWQLAAVLKDGEEATSAAQAQ